MPTKEEAALVGKLWSKILMICVSQPNKYPIKTIGELDKQIGFLIEERIRKYVESDITRQRLNAYKRGFYKNVVCSKKMYKDANRSSRDPFAAILRAADNYFKNRYYE